MILSVVRTAITVVVFGMILIAAGCGETGHGSVTKAQAVAFARAVNLRAADVPTTQDVRARAGVEIDVAIPSGGDAPGVSRDRELLCAGAPGAGRALAMSQSPPFTRSGWAAISAVRVVPNNALALADIAAIATARGRACMTPGGGARVTTIRGLRVKVPHGPGLVGTRVAVGPPGLPRSPRSQLYVDAITFAVGQAEITLGAVSGERPPPASVERDLVSLLYSRAKAHGL
jgi:hypothetical protein